MLTEFLSGCSGMTLAGTAADGPSALKLLEREEPQAAVLDLILPGMGGLEVISRYRHGGGKARLLVLTRAGGAAATGAALDAGADLVLLKPFQLAELERCLRLLTGGLSHKLRALLEEMGGQSRLLGFDLAVRCAAQIAREQPRLMKEVYLQAAAGAGATYAQVEKDIRKLVQDLHEKNTPAYRRVMGPDWSGERPANRDFLRALAQAVKIPL